MPLKFPPARPAAHVPDSLVSLAAIVMLGVCALVAVGVADSSRGLVAAVAGGVARGSAALLYFAPALVAFDRRHPGCKAIAVLNALLGWTVFGWIALLVFALRPAAWSFGDPTGPAIPAPRKRCLSCRGKLGIDAATCIHCGSVQPN